MRRYLVLISCLFISIAALSQQDTVSAVPTLTVLADTAVVSVPVPVISNQPPAVDTPWFEGDSLSKKPIPDYSWQPQANISLVEQVLKHHPFFPFSTKAFADSIHRKMNGKEDLFYVLVALGLIFALLKLAFEKYFTDLFRVFFRTTMKQRQIGEQLMQNPLPSLLYNLFFIASTALYLDFLLHYYEIRPSTNFWLVYLYCALGLSIIYLIKYLGLKVCGWLFNMKQATDSYIFIVFIINKMIGIFLLPFLVLLAFSDGIVHAVSLVLTWTGIAALLIYRFILGYGAVRNEVRFNLFHFFLYLVAFEVAPLLLIYKLLLAYFK